VNCECHGIGHGLPGLCQNFHEMMDKTYGCVALRYLAQNMDWLEEELGGYDDDYLIFDCPGMPLLFQIQ
jgi:hypothetical protein